MLKDGEIACNGTYEELEATGYNIKDILDSFNNAMMVKEGDKNKFKDEVKKTESPSKKVEKD